MNPYYYIIICKSGDGTYYTYYLRTDSSLKEPTENNPHARVDILDSRWKGMPVKKKFANEQTLIDNPAKLLPKYLTG